MPLGTNARVTRGQDLTCGQEGLGWLQGGFQATCQARDVLRTPLHHTTGCKPQGHPTRASDSGWGWAEQRMTVGERSIRSPGPL